MLIWSSQMALHDPPIDIPFVDLSTGMVTRAWQEWLVIAKRDKANREENATANNIALLDEDGHPIDSNSAIPSEAFVGTTEEQQLANKTFAELVGTKVLASDGSGGLSETDLSGWVDGTSGRITVTDDGDGTITLTVPLKSNFGITSDANGLSLNQQANETDASNISAVSLSAGSDSIDLSASNTTLSTMRTEINAIVTKVNAILAILLNSELMASP